MDTALTLSVSHFLNWGAQSDDIITGVTEAVQQGTEALFTDTQRSTRILYELRELDWIRIIGREEFFSLDKRSRDFLVQTAGALDLGGNLDIDKVFRASPDEEE